jgi:hypothetical protein
MSNKFPYNKDRRRRAIHTKVLDQALTKAADGDVKMLANCLRAGFAITEKHQLEALADLVAPPKRGRGRPKGPDPSQRAEAKRMIVAIIRVRERKLLKKKNKLARGDRLKLIRELFADPGDDDRFSFKNPITEDEIYSALNRGGSSRKIPN